MANGNPIHYLQTKLDNALLMVEGLRKMCTDLTLALLNSQQENQRLKKLINELRSR